MDGSEVLKRGMILTNLMGTVKWLHQSSCMHDSICWSSLQHIVPDQQCCWLPRRLLATSPWGGGLQGSHQKLYPFEQIKQVLAMRAGAKPRRCWPWCVYVGPRKRKCIHPPSPKPALHQTYGRRSTSAKPSLARIGNKAAFATARHQQHDAKEEYQRLCLSRHMIETPSPKRQQPSHQR